MLITIRTAGDADLPGEGAHGFLSLTGGARDITIDHNAIIKSAAAEQTPIVGRELPSGVVGSPYAGSFTVRGGDGPYAWSIAAQPHIAGAFSLRVTVKDSS